MLVQSHRVGSRSGGITGTLLSLVLLATYGTLFAKCTSE